MLNTFAGKLHGNSLVHQQNGSPIGSIIRYSIFCPQEQNMISSKGK